MGKMSALKQFMLKHGPVALDKAKKFASENKGALAAGVGIPAVVGAGAALEPKFDDFMTEQAIESMKRKAKRGLVDSIDFAEKHPYITAGAIGGSGALGAMGGQDYTDVVDSMSPLKVASLYNKRKHRRE